MKIELRQCNSKKCLGTMTNWYIDPNSGAAICGRCATIKPKEDEVTKLLKGFGYKKK